MNGIRFALVSITLIFLLVCCAETETALQKHQVFCKHIITKSYWLYNSGADSLLSEDQYSDFIHELSITEEMMTKWQTEIQGK